MYDFILISITHVTWGAISRNPHLKWLPLVDSTTGELNPVFENYKKREKRPEMIAYYKGLTFEKWVLKRKDKRVTIELKLRGSWHIYKNGGKHNHDDYTLRDHENVINTMRQLFGIDPYKATIHHVEFAVNLRDPKYKASQIVQSLLVQAGQGGPPKEFGKEYHRSASELRRTSGSQRDTKSYNKGLQHNLPYDVWRFEAKYKKMDKLANKGLKTLADTLNPSIIEMLKKTLLKQWKGVILYDFTVNKSQLSDKDKIRLKDFRSRGYWMEVSQKRNGLTNALKEYNRILEANSEEVHKYLEEEISKKWDYLVTESTSKKCKMTTSGGNHSKSRKMQDDLYNIVSPCTEMIEEYQLINQQGAKTISGYQVESTTLGLFGMIETKKKKPKGDSYPIGHSENTLRKKVRNDNSNFRNNRLRDLRNCLNRIVVSPSQLMMFPIDQDLNFDLFQDVKFSEWEGTELHPSI